jgi:hypothetical protein
VPTSDGSALPSTLRGGVGGGGPQMMAHMIESHEWKIANDSLHARCASFWNHDVLGNLDGALSEIQRVLTPTPDPSPQGDAGGGERAGMRSER